MTLVLRALLASSTFAIAGALTTIANGGAGAIESGPLRLRQPPRQDQPHRAPSRSGWLLLSLLRVESLDQVEDHLIVAAVTDKGEP